MRALVYTRYGGPEVLRLENRPKPVPGNGEVLVRIRASSINSWDWDLLRGKPFLSRLGGLFSPPHPILGADIAGTVEAAGPKTKKFRPGDAVFGDISGCGWGGFAEHVSVPEKILAFKSPKQSFEEAASLPQAGVLALQGLRMNGPIQAGQKILINGAGGGVGTFAIQIAKSCGAVVTAVDSAEKGELLKSLGAHKVLDYAREDFAQDGKRYNLILDMVAARPIAAYQRSLYPNGRLVVIGGSTGLILKILFLGPWYSGVDRKKFALLFHRPNAADLDALKELCESGAIKPVIERSYSLEEAPEAIRRLGEGKALGKCVVSI
ncbi:MAG: NAD(P)-dependent alcohol dehydrogenase [Spirochaetia bacterium]|nr:NAD(P)-dependent alcohol dehydrogenase [Spirochaetia bacterium]